MPSLIRFLIVLLFLAGLVFGGMVALSIFVVPREKVVTVNIPARDLFEEQSFFDTPTENKVDVPGFFDTESDSGSDQ